MTRETIERLAEIRRPWRAPAGFEPPLRLPRGWHNYKVGEGVNDKAPGIYEWAISGVGVYIGRCTHRRRPRRAYGWNVANLYLGKPYRPLDPTGFRTIHHALAWAHYEAREIRLTYIENVPDEADRRAREEELIRERGSLNDPPYFDPALTRALRNMTPDA